MKATSCLVFTLMFSIATCYSKEAASKPKKVLYFTKSSKFEHSVVKRVNGELSFSEKILQKLGKRWNIAFTFSKDGSLFTHEYLAQFDAFCFYTTGNLLEAGNDGNPPMTIEGKNALLDAVKQGKGFIGIHSASDTFHFGETFATNTDCVRTWRYRNLGPLADSYTQMLGAELILHGRQQVATALITDDTFPGLDALGKELTLMEEWYSMTDFGPDLHVLMTMKTDGMKGKPYERPAYPLTWARMHGKGRVFYTALGHREDVWTNALFQKLLHAGIMWSLGETQADVSPNSDVVAPQASALPPFSENNTW